MIRRLLHRPLLAAPLAAAAAWGTARAVSRHPPGGPERWRRPNFRGRPVDLYSGPAAAAGAAVAATAGPAPAGVVVTAAVASLGLYDDLFGDRHARGLRGHLRALYDGRVTTGMVKLVGLSATGMAGALAAGRRDPASLMLDTVLVAGSANLLNLLDLRPGRALKAASAVAVLSAGPPANRGAAAATLATALVLLPADLDERSMLGDCGANTFGALLGWTVAHGCRRSGRVAASFVVVVLTLLSERVSLSAAIQRSPVLSRMDAWGRRPT